MRSLLGVLARLLVVTLVLAAGVAAVGVLVAHVRDSSVGETVAYAYWIAGATIILVIGVAGSPSRNLAEGRVELGGRMTGAALPQTPLGYGLIGFVLAGIGVLVYALG